MPPNNPVPRILQQQPPRDSDPEQQQSGSTEFQPKPEAKQGEQQMGEGSYEATRDYNERIQEYMKKADVEGDAQKAKPRSEDEAREMKQAEEEGRSHSEGER
jgi:hypothetical protein